MLQVILQNWLLGFALACAPDLNVVAPDFASDVFLWWICTLMVVLVVAQEVASDHTSGRQEGFV